MRGAWALGAGAKQVMVGGGSSGPWLTEGAQRRPSRATHRRRAHRRSRRRVALTNRDAKRHRALRTPSETATTPSLETLTSREMGVYRLIAAGSSNAEIGRELYISDTTVKTHVTRLLQLSVRDRAQAIVLAYQCGVFER